MCTPEVRKSEWLSLSAELNSSTIESVAMSTKNLEPVKSASSVDFQFLNLKMELACLKLKLSSDTSRLDGARISSNKMLTQWLCTKLISSRNTSLEISMTNTSVDSSSRNSRQMKRERPHGMRSSQKSPKLLMFSRSMLQNLDFCSDQTSQCLISTLDNGSP